MEHRSLFSLALCAAALGLASFAGQTHAQGITLGDQSSTKALSAVGKSDSETTVYTDTMGLSPQPNFNEIQDNPNFILSEQAFPEPPPAQDLRPVQMNVAESTAVQPPVSEAREKFVFFDKNENGLLDENEFFLFELSADARQIFEDVDKNADTAISFNEFEPYFTQKKDQ